MFPLDFPKACLINDGKPLRWSVGFYRGKRRCVSACFAYYSEALDYFRRSRVCYPHLKFDIIQTLF